MCDTCEKSSIILQNIADLSSNIKYGTDDKWETSEALTAGGPGGASSTFAVYKLRSPFDKTVGQQYSVKIASSGAGTSTIFIAPDNNIVVPGLTSSDTATGEISTLPGVLIVCPANTSIPIDEGWYSINNSNGILYISVKTSQSAYVTIQFRRKR